MNKEFIKKTICVQTGDTMEYVKDYLNCLGLYNYGVYNGVYSFRYRLGNYGYCFVDFNYIYREWRILFTFEDERSTHRAKKEFFRFYKKFKQFVHGDSHYKAKQVKKLYLKQMFNNYNNIYSTKDQPDSLWNKSIVFFKQFQYNAWDDSGNVDEEWGRYYNNQLYSYE